MDAVGLAETGTRDRLACVMVVELLSEELRPRRKPHPGIPRTPEQHDRLGIGNALGALLRFDGRLRAGKAAFLRKGSTLPGDPVHDDDPFQITMIPQYILMVWLGLTDTYLGLIAPYAMTALSIILFRQFFMSIPQALIDAARVDGCSDLRILFRIVWPLSRPVVITVGILTFMTVWNDVLWPIIVIRERSMMTMPQLVALFVTGGEAEGQLGAMLASATMLALPVISSV
jgi:hypothetical protein